MHATVRATVWGMMATMEQHAKAARQHRDYRKECPAELRESWEERAAILEYEAGLHRLEAERRAFEMVVNGQAG